MDFNEYQHKCAETAIYPNAGNNLTYPVLGLCGESGEVAEALKKLQRDHNNELTPEYRDKMVKELGDVLWYAARIASELNVSLNDVATTNIKKLNKRQQENKLHGEGSDR